MNSFHRVTSGNYSTLVVVSLAMIGGGAEQKTTFEHDSKRIPSIYLEWEPVEHTTNAIIAISIRSKFGDLPSH